MSTTSCAECGRIADGLKTCTGCKQVKYCNVDCQRAHRPKHRKECQKQKRAAELRKNEGNEAMDSIIKPISDEDLFRDPPAKEECSICCHPMSIATRETAFRASYQFCCGKFICWACIDASGEAAVKHTSTAVPCCPFCRQKILGYPESPSECEECINRYKKRMEGGDPEAFLMLGSKYEEGDWGCPKDLKKAVQLYTQAAELGSVAAMLTLGGVYYNPTLRFKVDKDIDTGINRDIERARFYTQKAAMGGHEGARHNCGQYEMQFGNRIDRAMKHWMIAASAGWDESLEMIGEGYKDGLVSKDDYAKTLRAHKSSRDEMASKQRLMMAAAGSTIGMEMFVGDCWK